MLLSIIIPAYNVEAYIKRCLESLQAIRALDGAYEVVVVDDGSTDGTAAVVEALQPAMPALKLLRQRNQGVSAARNTGMAAATGTYLMMVDADDYLLPQVLAPALQQAQQQQLDILTLGIEVHNAAGQPVETVTHTATTPEVTPGTVAYLTARARSNSLPDTSTARLYRRQLLQQYAIRFTPGVAYLEDGEFIARCFCVAARCAFSAAVVYVRTTRPGSAVHSNLLYTPATGAGFLTMARQLAEFRKHPQLSAAQQQFLNLPVAKFSMLPFQYAPITLLRQLVQQVHQHQLLPLQRQQLVAPYSHMAARFNTSPVWFWLWWKWSQVRRSVQHKWAARYSNS